VLAEQEWGESHRNRGLGDEHDRGDLDRRARLQGAHLTQRPDARGDRGAHGPDQRQADAADLQIVGRELGCKAAPGEAAARAEHRQLRTRVPEQVHHVGRQGDYAERHEHDRRREHIRDRCGVARRAQPGADDAGDDRQHAEVLVATGALVEHPLAGEHQHEQPGGQRRLDHRERRKDQRQDLQREAQDRQARAEQPAAPADEAHGQRQAQVLVVGSLLCVHRLQGDP